MTLRESASIKYMNVPVAAAFDRPPFEPIESGDCDSLSKIKHFGAWDEPNLID